MTETLPLELQIGREFALLGNYESAIIYYENVINQLSLKLNKEDPNCKSLKQQVEQEFLLIKGCNQELQMFKKIPLTSDSMIKKEPKTPSRTDKTEKMGTPLGKRRVTINSPKSVKTTMDSAKLMKSKLSKEVNLKEAQKDLNKKQAQQDLNKKEAQQDQNNKKEFKMLILDLMDQDMTKS